MWSKQSHKQKNTSPQQQKALELIKNYTYYDMFKPRGVYRWLDMYIAQNHFYNFYNNLINFSLIYIHKYNDFKELSVTKSRLQSICRNTQMNCLPNYIIDYITDYLYPDGIPLTFKSKLYNTNSINPNPNLFCNSQELFLEKSSDKSPPKIEVIQKPVIDLSFYKTKQWRLFLFIKNNIINNIINTVFKLSDKKQKDKLKEKKHKKKDKQRAYRERKKQNDLLLKKD